MSAHSVNKAMNTIFDANLKRLSAIAACSQILSEADKAEFDQVIAGERLCILTMFAFAGFGGEIEMIWVNDKTIGKVPFRKVIEVKERAKAYAAKTAVPGLVKKIYYLASIVSKKPESHPLEPSLFLQMVEEVKKLYPPDKMLKQLRKGGRKPKTLQQLMADVLEKAKANKIINNVSEESLDDFFHNIHEEVKKQMKQAA